MSTQLKKGDRCQSPHGIVTIEEIRGFSNLVLVNLQSKGSAVVDLNTLTRIPTHAERMQKIVDTVFAAENNFEDDQFMPMKVGDLAEFVRHYLAIRDELESAINADKRLGGQLIEAAQLSEKLLKGEL